MTNIILRLLWSIFIGSWLTPIWYFFGMLFTALIITGPLGIWFFDRIGYVFSLYEGEGKESVTLSKTFVGICWFYLVGWWLGLIVVSIASACVGTIIFFPIGWWLINRLDKVVVLG
ncbi:MAG: hypothetical protein ACFFDW_14770 [Candidatus Thorarchaeota archaeon]